MPAHYCDNIHAYVLHAQYFTDSKRIVRLFTQEYGLVSAVLRISKKQLLPSPFTPITLSWSGKHNLKTLLDYQEITPAYPLIQRSLYCGMYLNELLLRTLPEFEVQQILFEQYAETIQKLIVVSQDNSLQEVLLRRFELSLLTQLGHTISLQYDVEQNAIEDSASTWYAYHAESGWVPVYAEGRLSYPQHYFLGEDIVMIAKAQWNIQSLKAAKRLCRLALHPLLGDKPLKSRELFT